MDKLKIYFLKALKRMHLLSHFNFVFNKKINGQKVKIPIINSVGLENMMHKKEWLDVIIECFIHSESKTFVDVGVNVGQTLLRLKTLSPQVKYLGFEPNSTCTSYSNKLININNILGLNTVIQNVALSTKVANLILEKDSDTDSRASVISNLRPDYFSRKEYILALDYQSFYLEEEISFVKIDVEGGELEVLSGMEEAIKKYQPIITCEVLDSYSSDVIILTQQRASMLCGLIKSWNYSIIQLKTGIDSSLLKSYQKIETIQIIQWDEDSSFLNDYLFYPSSKETYVVDKLNNFVKYID